MAPVLSVTLTKRFTSLTSMRKVVSWATTTRGENTTTASPRRGWMVLRNRIGDPLRTMRSLRGMDRKVFGKWFSRRPHDAICKGLFLPDRHCLFERVDQPAAGVESLRAVGRCHDDQHAGFAHVEPAQAVNQGHVANEETLNRLARQRVHLLEGHL